MTQPTRTGVLAASSFLKLGQGHQANDDLLPPVSVADGHFILHVGSTAWGAVLTPGPRAHLEQRASTCAVASQAAAC
jgi:hypothetical protein